MVWYQRLLSNRQGALIQGEIDTTAMLMARSVAALVDEAARAHQQGRWV